MLPHMEQKEKVMVILKEVMFCNKPAEKVMALPQALGEVLGSSPGPNAHLQLCPPGLLLQR